MRRIALALNRALAISLAFALSCGSGCGPYSITAGFPEVTPQTVEHLDTAPKIDVVRVADSRGSRFAGMVGATNIMVGPDLTDYLDRKFRNELASHGFVTPLSMTCGSRGY